MTDLASTRFLLDLTDPVETLAYIPFRLGFHPRESLVILAVRRDGDDVDMGLVARVDLADVIDPTQRERLRASILNQLRADDTVHAFLAVYDEETLEGFLQIERTRPASTRAQQVGHELGWWLDHEEFHPRRAYLVGDSRWRCLICPDPDHCPEEGRAVEDFQSARISTAMVLRGRQAAPSREELITVGPTPPERRARGLRWFAGEHLAYLHAVVRGRRWGWRAAMVRRWQYARAQALQAPERPIADLLAPELLGRLGAALVDTHLRDAIIYALCTGTAVTHPSDELNRRLQAFFNEPQPPPEEIHRCLQLWQAIAEHCLEGHRADIFASWAWCNWWSGNTTEASLLVERARAEDPRNSLAVLLDQLLTTYTRPPWARPPS